MNRRRFLATGAGTLALCAQRARTCRSELQETATARNTTSLANLLNALAGPLFWKGKYHISTSTPPAATCSARSIGIASFPTPWFTGRNLGVAAARTAGSADKGAEHSGRDLFTSDGTAHEWYTWGRDLNEFALRVF